MIVFQISASTRKIFHDKFQQFVLYLLRDD
jgi:hypothetical protein